MKKLLVATLVVAGLTLMSTAAQASGLFRRHSCESACATTCCPASVCAPAITWVEKTVTCYKLEWKERDVPVKVVKCVPREVVTKEKCTIMVLETKDVSREVTCYSCRAKLVEQQVPVCRMVPVSTVDPCTGCCRTCYKPVTEMQKCNVTVFESVPEKKVITVKQCNWVPKEQTYECKRIVLDRKEETVMHKERYCVQVPYEVKVKVPACCN